MFDVVDGFLEVFLGLSCLIYMYIYIYIYIYLDLVVLLDV
jgi:hypothetical protein